MISSVITIILILIRIFFGVCRVYERSKICGYSGVSSLLTNQRSDPVFWLAGADSEHTGGHSCRGAPAAPSRGWRTRTPSPCQTRRPGSSRRRDAILSPQLSWQEAGSPDHQTWCGELTEADRRWSPWYPLKILLLICDHEDDGFNEWWL